MSTNTLIAVVVIAALITVVLDRLIFVSPPGRKRETPPPTELDTKPNEWPEKKDF